MSLMFLMPSMEKVSKIVGSPDEASSKKTYKKIGKVLTKHHAGSTSINKYTRIFIERQKSLKI